MQSQKNQTRANCSSSKAKTEHICLNTKHCKACWKCVEACSKNVIGKINFFFHRHAVIKKLENCTACFKCVNVCEHSAIRKGGAL